MKEKFLEIYESFINRPGSDDLLAWLESTDFYEAPASTRFHLSRPGGLVEHSIHVYERLYSLYKAEHTALNAPGEYHLKAWEMETIAIVGLLHDICKVNCYVQQPRNQKVYDQKKIAAAEAWQIKYDAVGYHIWEAVMGYRFEDSFPYGHGEKSVYTISKFMKLTDEEAMAIRWHMGFSDNDFKAGGLSVSNAFNACPLAVLAHVADIQATYLDETAEGEDHVLQVHTA